ncbi:hypothetical protein CP03DC29_0779A, partial [Chlamydia psittaci 03DC29]
MYKRIF